MQDDGGVYFAPLQPSPNESPDSTDANTSDAGGVCSWAHSQPKDRAQLCGGISASRRARFRGIANASTISSSAYGLECSEILPPELPFFPLIEHQGAPRHQLSVVGHDA